METGTSRRGVPTLPAGGWPRRPFQGLVSMADMGLVGIGGRWPPNRWLEAVGTAIGIAIIILLNLATPLEYIQGRPPAPDRR